MLSVKTAIDRQVFEDLRDWRHLSCEQIVVDRGGGNLEIEFKTDLFDAAVRIDRSNHFQSSGGIVAQAIADI